MTALPSEFTTAITAAQTQLWITFEIEGWQTAYSNRALTSGWFSARASALQPSLVKQLLQVDDAGRPMQLNLSAVTLDLLKSRTSMGTLRVPLVDVDGSLAGLTGLRRSAPAELWGSIPQSAFTAGTTAFYLTFTGDNTAIDANYPAPSGQQAYLFVGRECFLQLGTSTTATVNGQPCRIVSVKRAQLGSVAVNHTGGVLSNTNGLPFAVSGAPAGNTCAGPAAAAAGTISVTNQPDVPRNVQCFFEAGWGGGNIEISGYDVNGVPASEVVTASAGNTVGGVEIWSTITGITNLTPHSGDSTTVTVQFGSSTPVNTQTNAPEGVTVFPRHLIDRKAWLRIGYSSPAQSAGMSDANMVLAFVGYIRDFGWDNGGRVLVLNCEDAQSKLKRPLFTDLTTRWFPNGATSEILATQIFGAGPQPTVNLNNLPPGFSFLGGERIFGRLNDGAYCLAPSGDQPLATTPSGAPTGWNMLFPQQDFCALPNNPGLNWWLTPTSGTPPLQAAWKPFLFIAQGTEGDGTNSALWNWGIWPNLNGAAWPSNAATVPADHVLMILLLVLCSTGTGSGQTDNFSTAGNNGATGWNFDLLRAEWGLGIPYSDIDIAGIVALATQQPGHRMNVPVFDTVKDAREWLIGLLRPFGYALIINAAGLLSVVSLAPQDPDAAAANPTLASDDLVLDSNGQPKKLAGPTSAGDRRMVAIKWSDSPFVRDGKLELRPPITLQISETLGTSSPVPDALALTGSIEPLEIEAWGLDSFQLDTDFQGGSGPNYTEDPNGRCLFNNSFRGLPSGIWGPQSVVANLLSNLAVRFAGPSFTMAMEVPLSFSGLSVGDFVELNFPWAPNPFTGARGLTNVTAQVMSRQANLFEGTLTLEVNISGAGNENSRFLAPSFVVSSWNSGTKTITVTNTFNPSGDNDTDALGPAGTLLSGMLVRVYTADHSARSGVVTVSSKTSTTLVLATAPSLAPLGGSSRGPIAGDVLELADYSDSPPAAAKSRYSWLADPTTDELGGTDPADGWMG